MKLSCTLLGLAALSATPFAAAEPPVQSPFTGEGHPYAIEIVDAGRPVAVERTRYPAAAAAREVNGKCSVRVTYDVQGATTSAEVLECSTPYFEKEAARTAQSATYASGEAGESVMHISWTIAPAEKAIAVAGLN